MSLVERIRAKKREDEREEEKASLSNESMGLADRIRNRASIDSDSLERDIKNFEAEYNTVKKWWHNAEDMSNLRNKAESIQNRVNAYANSGSYIKGLDAGSLVSKYSTVLDDIDILSNKYSMYESKDAYKPTDINRDELIAVGKSKQNIFSDNPSIQQMLRSENDNGIYDLMTDDEKNEFYYQTGKLGTSGGNEYLKGLDSVLKKRAYESSASKMKESSESSAVASVVNNLASSFGVGYGYVDDLLRTATRRDIDEYNIGHLMSEIEESSREATKQHARETFGESAVTDFLVDTGLSIGQSAVRLPLGNVGLAVAGLGAATQGAESARERGASDWQALFAGGAQGIAEAAMENVSLGGLKNILEESAVYTVKDIAKNVLKQMGAEASEEIATELANTVTDRIIMGDKSEFVNSMNAYMASGYDESTARNKAIGDVVKNVALAGLGGALSGGVMGGTFSGINAYGQYTAGKNSNITDYNEFAESLDTDPESYENAEDLEKVENLKAYAKELADSQAKGEKVTNLQKGAFERDLYNMENDLIESQKANDPEVKREKRVESLKKGEVTEVTSTGNSTRLDGLRFKDGKTMLQTSEGEYAAEDMTLTQNDAELVSYAESMNEEKANLLVAQYDGKTNVGDYVESFNLAYSYGETGFGTDFVLKNKGVLTERQALNAYKEATMAKARKNAEAFENAVDKTITREMLGGRFDDSIIDYDGSGKGTVKWNMLTSSEKMNINAAKVIAGAMKNTRFEFIESRVENGEYKGENARWNPTTRTISIDVHAGRNKLTDENSYIMSAMSHEITHSFERTAAEEYANLRDHVMNYLANRDGIDASELIARKRMQIGDSHAKRGIELTDEKVINEIVADACEEMLVNSKKVDEYLNGMDENTKKSFIGKVKETFENIIKAINDVIKKLDPRTKEARALRESKEDFEKALELWDKAFAKANETIEENTTAREFIEQAVVQLSARTDGKMDLDATVEQKDGLVAVHNLTEDKLEKTFKLEGFPMPSIAITKAALGHSDFGSISFVFGKDTINPSKKKNKVYGADAWTPTFPRVEYEADFGRIREIKSDLNHLIDKLPERIRNSANAFLSGLEYNLDNYGGYEGVVDRALNDEAIKQLYLAATDNVVEDIMIEKRTEMHEVDVEISKNILDSIDVDIVGVSKKSGREIFEEYGQLIKNAMKKAYLANGISAETADNVIEKTNKFSIVSQLRTARDYKLNGGVKVENVLDYGAISKEINSRIDSAKYEKWVKETFDGIVKNEGIYNGKDYFTPSGNRKSFAQTHFPVTADNIVKAMIAQNDDVRNVSGFNGIKSIRAMAVEEFKSIKSIKQAKNKLKNIDSIEYEAMNEKLSKRLYGVIESILESSNRSSGNSYVDMDNIGFSILDTCANPTVENIRKILEGYHWTCSESQAKEIKSIIEEVADMPVNMFEAKPQRVVGFNEILCAIVPNDISEKTRKLISDKEIPIREYESGNDESRLKVLNSLEGVQFSDRISTEEAREFSDVSIQYSIREEAPPKTTAKAYKVFLLKNGQLYPPMVANPGGEGTPVGVWLNADAAPRAEDSKTGRPQVQAGGKGTNTGKMTLAYRPGWHLGDIPQATQFAKKNPETGLKELFPSNFVWAECEYATDVDYQEEAMSYGYNKNGKFQHSLAGLPKIPKDGYYRYRTNPNPDTVPWVITGAMRVNRILTDKETDAICRANGVEPLKRMGGPLTEESLADMGLTKLDHTQYSNRDSEHYHYDEDNVVVIDTKMFSNTKVKKNYKEVNSLVRSMLKELVGKQVTIKSDGRVVLFDLATAKEYTGSVATYSMDAKRRGAKANISIALERIVESAKNPFWTENKKEKHNKDAERGWTYYDLVFGINDAEVTEYYSARLVIRMDVNGKDYVYDVDNINEKKEAKLPNKLGVRPASDNSLPESDDDVKFSDRYEDTFFDLFDSDGTFVASSAIIEEDVDRLKQRLSMGASSMSDDNIKMIAKHLLQKADSRYDFEELSDDLKDIYGYIENHDYFEGNALIAKCNDVARRILSEQKETKVTNDYAKMVLKEIRNTKNKPDAEQIAEAKNRYGEKYRNALFGRITISNEGVSLDSKWADWSAQYPDIFDANISSANQITELADIYDSLREASEVKQRFDSASDVRALGAEIYNQYWIRSTISAESEKNQQKIKELNLKHRNAMKKLREDYQKRLENQRLANSMHYGKIINEIRQRNKDEVKKAKALGKEHMDAYKDRVARKAKIEKITNTSLTLNNWIKKNSKDHPVPEILKKPVVHLLDAIDFSSKQMLRSGKPTQKDNKLALAFAEVEKMALKIDATNARIEKSDVDDMYINLPSSLVAEIEQLSTIVNNITNTIGNSTYVLNEMSLEELEKLDNIITAMKRIIMTANECHVFHHERGIRSFASNLIGYLDTISDKKISNLISNFFEYDNASPFYVFKRMGEYGMKMFEAFQDAWDVFAFNIKAIEDYANEAYTSKEVQEWRRKRETFTVLDTKRTTDVKDPKYKEVTMTHAQIMGLYLLNKREQAREHIYKGGIRIADINLKGKMNPITDAEGFTVTPEDVRRFTSVLSDRQIEVAEKLSKFMNTVCSDWGNKVTMALYGIKGFTEENYYPIKTDENSRAVKGHDDDTSIYRLLNMPFTKSLTPKANNKLVVDDIFNVFSSHCSDMAKYSAFALPITDFMKVYSYNSKNYTSTDGQYDLESMQTSIERAMGKGMKKYIRTFLEDINSSQHGGRGEEISKKMMSNYKIASVGANLNVALLQPLSYVRASAVLPAKYLLFRGNMLHWKKGSEKAMKYSGIAVWKSMGFYDTDISRGVQAQITHDDSMKDKLVEKSMTLAEIGDRFTWGALWNACELEVKDRCKDLTVGSDGFNKEVALKFREVVYSTQVVDSTLTRTQMMRSKSGLTQTLTAFMSEPSLTYNMVADTFFEWSLEGRRGYSRSIGKYGKKFAKSVAIYSATALLSAAVRSATDIFRDDDEEEDNLEEYLENLKDNAISEMNPFSKLPIMKDVVSIFEGYDPTRLDEQSLVSIKRAYDAWKKVIVDDKDVDYKVVYKTLQAISQTSGLPLSNAYRDVIAMWNTSIGNVYPSLKVDTK